MEICKICCVKIILWFFPQRINYKYKDLFINKWVVEDCILRTFFPQMLKNHSDKQMWISKKRFGTYSSTVSINSLFNNTFNQYIKNFSNVLWISSYDANNDHLQSLNINSTMRAKFLRYSKSQMTNPVKCHSFYSCSS